MTIRFLCRDGVRNLFVYIIFALLVCVAFALFGELYAQTQEPSQPEIPSVAEPKSPDITLPKSPESIAADSEAIKNQSSPQNDTHDNSNEKNKSKDYIKSSRGLFGRKRTSHNNKTINNKKTTATTTSAVNAASNTVTQKTENQDDTKNEKPLYQYKKPVTREKNYFGLVTRSIIIILVFIAAVYFLFKWLAQQKTLGGRAVDVVKIHSVVPLGTGKSLQIVEIAGRMMVLGTTEHSINLLTEIDDAEMIQSIKVAGAQANYRQGTFQGVLDDLIQKVVSFSKRPSSAGSTHAEKTGKQHARQPSSQSQQSFNLDFLRMQNERIQKLKK